MKKALFAVGLGVLLILIGTSASAVSGFLPHDPDRNHAWWWEGWLGDGSSCGKIETNATPFSLGAAPSGFVWRLLVIKAGSHEHANAYWFDPSPGSYSHPDGKTTSHVIVCKRRFQQSTTTTAPPTTTPQPSTTTTQPPTTTTQPPTTTAAPTTTVPQTTTTSPRVTTTTVPQPSTSLPGTTTTVPGSTTTVPLVTTTSVVPSSSTTTLPLVTTTLPQSPPGGTTPPGGLPRTGPEGATAAVAAAVLGLGLSLWWLARRRGS